MARHSRESNIGQTQIWILNKLAATTTACNSPVIVRTGVKYKLSNPSTKGHLMRGYGCWDVSTERDAVRNATGKGMASCSVSSQ